MRRASIRLVKVEGAVEPGGTLDTSGPSVSSCGPCSRRMFETMKSTYRNLLFTSLLACVAPMGFTQAAASDDLNFRIPPVTTSIGVQDVHIAIVASGSVARIGTDKGQDLFQVNVNADLGDLQRNLAPFLKAEIDRDDRCGDRISLQDAMFVPAAPAGLLTVRIHYERYACAKALGKQIVKRLVGGNATIEVKLTPQVEDHEAVKLAAEVTVKDADGSLGELLRSSDFGQQLRERIAASVQKAISKVTEKNAPLPPALREMARLDEARFADGGGGVLTLQLRGTIRLSMAQMKGALGAAAGISAKGAR